MDTINELLIGIGYPVTQQDGFAQPAQDASFDGAKPQPVDQQSSGFPDDFVLEDEVLWLDGTVGKVIFQLEEWMEPCAMACEDGRSVAEDGEGGFVLWSPSCFHSLWTLQCALLAYRSPLSPRDSMAFRSLVVIVSRHWKQEPAR